MANATDEARGGPAATTAEHAPFGAAEAQDAAGDISPRAERLGLAVVAGVYVLIVLFAIRAPFSPIDDQAQLVFVRSAPSVAVLLNRDYFGFVRPFKNLLFLAFSHLEKFGMPAVRLIPIAIGLVAIVLLHAVMRDVLKSRGAALLATAAWAWAPTLVSSTVWLSAVNVMLMTVFALAALRCHRRALAVGTPGRIALRWVALATGCQTLALAAYEGAVAVPALLAAVDAYRHPARWRERRTWLTYAAYGLATLVYLTFRAPKIADPGIIGGFSRTTRAQAALAAGWFIVQHLEAWLWPFGRLAVLGVYYPGLVSVAALAASWTAVISIGTLALAVRRRHPQLGLGLAWFLLGFAPMSNLAGFRNGPWGDYYLTLPSLGLAVAATALLVSVWRQRHRAFPWRVGAGLIALLWLLSRTAAAVEATRWARAWNDAEEVHRRTLRAFPQSYKPMYALAIGHIKNGRFDEATSWLDRAAAAAPDNPFHLALRAMIAYRRGDFETALRLARTYQEARPDDPWAHGFLGGLAEDYLRDEEAAMALYRRALEHHSWNEDMIQPATRLAYLLAVRDRTAQAIALWETVSRIQPENAEVHQNLAIAHARLGNAGRSAFHQRRAAELRQRNR